MNKSHVKEIFRRLQAKEPLETMKHTFFEHDFLVPEDLEYKDYFENVAKYYTAYMCCFMELYKIFHSEECDEIRIEGTYFPKYLKNVPEYPDFSPRNLCSFDSTTEHLQMFFSAIGFSNTINIHTDTLVLYHVD